MLIYLGSICATAFVLWTLYSDGYFDKSKQQEYTNKLKEKENNVKLFDEINVTSKFPSFIN